MILINKLNLKYLLNAVMPLLSLLVIIILVTYFIYNEKNKSNLAVEGEINLVGQFLQSSPKIINYHDIDRFTVLNMHPDNKEQLDASLESYSNVVKEILQHQPELLVIRLMTSIGQKKPADFIKLKNTIDTYNTGNTKIVITYPQGVDKNTPQIYKKTATMLDDDICRGFYCPYNKTWGDWSIQWFINYFSQPNFQWQSILTSDLNKSSPVFFIAVADPNEFYQLDVKEFMSKPKYVAREDIQNKFIFIGSELTRPGFHPLFSKGARGYQSIFNIKNPESYGNLSAPHLFWAQIAHMSLANNFIKIAHKSISWIYIILCLLILLFSLRKSTITGFLNTGVLFLLVWLIITTILFVFYRTYLLSFSVYYILCLSILLGVFTKFSAVLVNNWRLEILHNKSRKTSHLKQNFISLISHNLNTPIAKLISLTELIRSFSKDKKSLIDVEVKLHEMEKTIKLVLAKHQLEEGLKHKTTYIFNDALTNTKAYFDRLNELLKYKITTRSSSEFNLPLKCDLKILQLCLLAYIESHCGLKSEISIDLSSTEKNILSIEINSTYQTNAHHSIHTDNIEAQLLDISQKNQFLSVRQDDTMHYLSMDWTR